MLIARPTPAKNKTGLVLSFPCVFPEPVLVKRYFYIEGGQNPFSLTVAVAKLNLGCVEREVLQHSQTCAIRRVRKRPRGKFRPALAVIRETAFIRRPEAVCAPLAWLRAGACPGSRDLW